MPIAVLSEYTEKEYEPFDPYSRFYPAMPISVCFSDTALYTLGKTARKFFILFFFKSYFFCRIEFAIFRFTSFFKRILLSVVPLL